MNLIDANHLTLRFGSKTALNDVSVKVPKGRVVGLLGHNGAGKTSLMKALVGLLPVQGDLTVLG
uniref:ATP-binding cassette domain-containing protein n=2 Tax=Pseudomonadota TaxID=1224 RepID=UPI0013D73C9C